MGRRNTFEKLEGGRGKNIYPKDIKQKSTQDPGNNRNTHLDDTHFRNTSPGTPSCSEAVDLMFRGRVPMANRLQDLVLDEHQFLELEELQEALEDATAKCTTTEVKFAQGILTGFSSAQAYLDAGYMAKAKGTRVEILERARKEATKLRKREHVAEYISAFLRLNHVQAMTDAGFSHVEWLKAQREVLEMAIGRKEIPKTFIINGALQEEKVRDACLGVANRSLEVLAKHYGWLNEKMQIEHDGPMVTLKDFTGMKPAPTEPPSTKDEDE